MKQAVPIDIYASMIQIHSHPTSCCSIAEIMSVLFFHTMKYKGTLYILNSFCIILRELTSSNEVVVFQDFIAKFHCRHYSAFLLQSILVLLSISVQFSVMV